LNVAIVFDSHSGTTARAARAMAQAFTNNGHSCFVAPVHDAIPEEIAQAQLICLGSWTQGLLLFGQHPTQATMSFVERLGDLAGKQAVVFCTYKIATGSTLPQMASALEQRGAQVKGHFKFRGPQPTGDFRAFVKGLPA